MFVKEQGEEELLRVSGGCPMVAAQTVLTCCSCMREDSSATLWELLGCSSGSNNM